MAVCVVALGAVIAAPSAGASVVIVTHTASALPGAPITVVVALRGTAKRCTGALHIGSSSITKSAAVRLKRATLHWALPPSAKPGRATVAVTCTPSGGTTTTVTVRAKPTPVIPAVVTVDKSGFSVLTTDVDREMNFGVVLRNTSPDEDALQVQVTANFPDASGNILDTEVNTITRIPAGTTFFYGGFGSTALENPAPVSLQATALVEEHAKATGVALPVATNLRFFTNDVGETEVQGQLTNPTKQTLVDLTEISYVLFDASGKVISGGVTSTGDPSQVAAVSASVDAALVSP